ncbi:MAG: AAA family ATPase, partial [Clostridia bacterium]|nr:AAA family ATPase [Clostridia bacterium]
MKFFAASNTEAGFVSYFAENFRRRADRCYIIKGGPGTGKSRLMREMGEAWENAGAEVEYYYCSSDPLSLDGLYVNCFGEGIAVMDGTAPHSEDIVNAGMVDNIIDLGRFWDAKILRERRKEISAFGEEKKRAYA